MQHSAAPLVLAKGFPVIALAEMHDDKGPMRAFPKWLGPDHGKRGVDRLAIALLLGEREAQDFECVQTALSICLTCVDGPGLVTPGQ